MNKNKENKSKAKMFAIVTAMLMLGGGLVFLVPADENDAAATSGTLYGMGMNGDGQIGDNSTSDVLTPTQIGSNIDNVVKVTGSRYTSFLLTSDGKLYGWGNNEYGQIGIGTTTDVLTPTQIGSDLGTIVDVQTDPDDGENTFFLTSDGKLYGMGRNWNGNLGTGDNTGHTTPLRLATSLGTITKMFITGGNTYVLNSDHELYGCGLNSNGQIGDGTTTNSKSFIRIGSSIGDIKDAYVGIERSSLFIIASNDDIYYCGNAAHNKVPGMSGNVTTPTQMTWTYGAIEKIVPTSYYTYFLTSDGHLYGIGGGSSTNLILPIDSSTLLSVMEGVADVNSAIGYDGSTSKYHGSTIILKTNGEVYGCGSNLHGQLGDGTTTTATNYIQIGSSLGTIDKIYSSSFTTFLLTEDGELYGCGWNANGQIGDNSTSDVLTPTQIGSNLDAVIDMNVTQRTTFFVTAPKLTITFNIINPQYGTLSANSIEVTSGSTITIDYTYPVYTFTADDQSVTLTLLPDTPQYRYTFGGYTYASTSEAVETGDIVTEDMTVDARLNRLVQTYSASIRSSNTAYGTVDVGTINNIPYGSEIHLSGTNNNILTLNGTVVTATANDPTAYYTYGFDGYEADGQPIQDGDIITGDRSIVANFSQTAIYTVIITPNNNEYGSIDVDQIIGVPANSNIVVVGNELTVNNVTSTATAFTDTVQYTYGFDGFYIGSTKITAETPVTDNMTVYANFTRTVQTYTITWSINGVTETETYEYGATPTHTDPSVTGYTFGGWNPTIASVTGDQTYTAILTPIQYIVTWNANGGTVDVATSTGSIEQSITAPTPTKKWYVFDGWFTAAEGGTQIESTFYPTENATYYAHWSELSYTITLDGNGGTPGSETVTGSPISSATLPTATNADKHLVGWFTETTEGTLVGIPGTIVYPSADVTYHAVWSDDVVYTYNVNFNMNGGYDGPSALVTTSTTEGTQTLTIPDTIPKTDNTSKKYFAGWSKSSTATTSTYKAGDEITVNANESITLYAVFTQSAPIDYGWMKVIPILVGVGLLVGVVSMFITNRMSAADLAKAIATIAVGVILLVFVLIPISGGF